MNPSRTQLLNEAKLAETVNQVHLLEDPWRLKFHLMPPVGWLNDPNGLCCCNGMYHIYFQYTPFDANGGLKLWGHYQSRDLIHFEYTGVPILPDTHLDCDGAYSGSALVEGDAINIFYTGNVKLEGDYDYINSGRISNTIWFKSQNGLTFDAKKCVLSTNDYPADLTQHVRDPKVFVVDYIYYMILGARDKTDKGLALIYTSADKMNWKYKNRITTPEPFGYMWECPDLFRLGEQEILSVSPQGLDTLGCNFQNQYQSGYFLLSGDFKNEYQLNAFAEWDHGFDFYAPQTFLDCDGRRILIAWMGMPDCESEYTNPTVEQGWQHALTLPRELTLSPDGTQVLQNPILEMEQLREREIVLEGTPQKHNTTIKLASVFELLLTDIHSADCRITICSGIALSYQQTTGIFEMQFLNNCGSGRMRRYLPLQSLDSIRVFVDTSSIEVFINSGEAALSTRFYPTDTNYTLQVDCTPTTLSLWELAGYRIT